MPPIATKPEAIQTSRAPSPFLFPTQSLTPSSPKNLSRSSTPNSLSMAELEILHMPRLPSLFLWELSRPFALITRTDPPRTPKLGKPYRTPAEMLSGNKPTKGVLSLPESILFRILSFLQEPQPHHKDVRMQQPTTLSTSAKACDPRDMYNFLTSCRTLYRGYYRYRDANDYMMAFSIDVGDYVNQAEAKFQNELWPLSSAVSIIAIDCRKAPNSSKTTKKEFLDGIGHNWIQMFLQTSADEMDTTSADMQTARSIMRNLDDHVLSVLEYHSDDAGRWSMLCRTHVNDFMILHGIDGLWENSSRCPLVVFADKKYFTAKTLFENLSNGEYTSIPSGAAESSLWNGFGFDDDSMYND